MKVVSVDAGVPGTAGLTKLPFASKTAGVPGTAGIFLIIVTSGIPAVAPVKPVSNGFPETPALLFKNVAEPPGIFSVSIPS